MRIVFRWLNYLRKSHWLADACLKYSGQNCQETSREQRRFCLLKDLSTRRRLLADTRILPELVVLRDSNVEREKLLLRRVRMGPRHAQSPPHFGRPE